MIAMMKKNKGRGYSMERLYRYLGITRQGLHQKQKAMLERVIVEETALLDVKKLRIKHPRMGSRSLYYSLGITGMGVTKFEELLSHKGLTISRKRKHIITTDSKGSKRYPNLTNGLVLTDINQLIVADITYYSIDNQTLYIFTLKDVYSQRVLSLRGSDNMKAINALWNLEDLVKVRGAGSLSNLICHSDNGSQYDSALFKNRLAELEIKISRAENSLQNGSAESLNDVIKNDYLFDHSQIKSLGQLQNALKDLKWKLNNEKAIKSLGYRTVVEFEKHILSLPSSKHPKKTLYDFEQE